MSERLLAAASTGGHRSELHRLLPRMLAGAAAVDWVTFDTPQSRSLLAGERVRLARGIIAILPSGAEVIRKIGHTDPAGLGVASRRALDSHALAAGRAPVFVPRRHAAREQIDHHQLELAPDPAARGLHLVSAGEDLDVQALRHAGALRARRRADSPRQARAGIATEEGPWAPS